MRKITHIIPSDGECDECGETRDLRPYGRNGAFVCFECGMKDEDEAKRQRRKLLRDSDVVIGG